MKTVDEPVRLAEHQPRWTEAFAREQREIVRALGIAPARLQHIGSTAVPGLVAKPIIDLMLGVARYPPGARRVTRICALGYECLGEHGLPGRLYFRKRGGVCANLHLMQYASERWHANLALRDYLRADADARTRYAAAKRAALAGGAATLLAYSEAKSATVVALLGEALRERGAA